MCGIAGIVGSTDPGVLGRVREMAASICHRGPDSDGLHHRDGACFAVRRLRIIDLVTGDQPIRSECTGATIVYNGELYNYKELREELIATGHRFTTRSDTEVALHFYEQHGIDALHRLNGIFAFAIDDPRRNVVVLVRDHLGVKPLYYARAADAALVFGSEPKAVLASGQVSREMSHAALAAYLTNGHSVGGRTIYEAIRKLPAGHAMIWQDGATKIQRFWDPIAFSRRWDPATPMPVDEIDALLRDAVRRNMLADVPVGAFLSGGIDSSLVTALMRRDAARLHTYSVGFGGRDDELPHALRVADQLGTTHAAITVTPADAAAAVDRLAEIYDEPFADAAAIPTYLMARRAREDVTVVLTGEGGDELFGGYRRYVAEQLYAPLSLVPSPIRRSAAALPLEHTTRLRRVGRVLRSLAQDDRTRRATTWTEVFSGEEVARLAHLPPDAASVVPAPGPDVTRDDVTALMLHEIATWLVDTYLEKVDKATMATSLEARVPLLDPRLVEALAFAPRSWKVDRGRTKVLLREVAARHIPMATVRRAKRGFGPPIDLWLRTTLSNDVRALGSRSAAIARVLDPQGVARVVSGYMKGEGRGTQVWTLLVLERWARREISA